MMITVLEYVLATIGIIGGGVGLFGLGILISNKLYERDHKNDWHPVSRKPH